MRLVNYFWNRMSFRGARVLFSFVPLILPAILASALMVPSVSRSDELNSLELERVKSLPYAVWENVSEEDRGKDNVISYNPDLAYEGVNVYCSEQKPIAYFMSMEGEVLHSIPVSNSRGCWLVEPYEEDFLMLLLGKNTLVRANANSSLEFKKQFKELRAHHDLSVAENGDIYVLTKQRLDRSKIRNISSYHRLDRAMDDVLVVLSSEGEVKERISFFDMISDDERFLSLLNDRGRHFFERELFHTNSIQVIERDVLSGKGVFFKEGQVLFCMRNLNLIGVADLDRREVVWWWGLNELQYPHHPTLLDNGNILVFDNGPRRKYSRIIELDPVKGEIVWEYTGNPLKSFFSQNRGSVQRLPNGNTLITESKKGRVFEVTPDGEVVWEFWNPERNRRGQRGTIYRMVRLDLNGDYSLKSEV